MSLACGAIIAALSHVLGASLSTQIIVCIFTTFLSFIFLRLRVKHTAQRTLFRTNVYALLGKQAVVTEPISRYTRGWVSIQGELWAAHTENESLLERGDVVEIIAIKEAHVVVKRK